MTQTSGASILAILEDTYREWLAAAARSGLGPEAAATPAAAAKLAPGRRSVGAVAVIPIRGFITQKPSLLTLLFGGTSTEMLVREIQSALADESVGAVVLDVDSPGGSVFGVPEAAAAIRAMRGTKPIIAAANPLMASAAYWLASQADEVVATPSALTGSIGVMALHVDESAALEKMGLKITEITSARRKAEGSSVKPLSSEARTAAQAMVSHFGQLFESDVAKGRRVGIERVRSSFGEGAVMPAPSAQAVGLVDSIASLHEVVAQVARSGYRPTTGARAYDPREIAAWAALTGVRLGVRAVPAERSPRRVYDPAELRAWARLAGIEGWRQRA